MRYALLAVFVLSGCATPADRAARMDAMIAKAGEACEKLGFKPDTDAMANCKLQLLNSADANSAARGNAAIQSRPRTCTTVGNQTTCY